MGSLKPYRYRLYRVPELGRISLPKSGEVAWVRHSPIDGNPTTAMVSREADCWFLSIESRFEADEARPTPGFRIGIEPGPAKRLVLSAGEALGPPRSTDRHRHRLATRQRPLACKTTGVLPQAKACLAVATLSGPCRAAAEGRCATRGHEDAMIHGAIVSGAIVNEDLTVRTMTASAAGAGEQAGQGVAARSGPNRSRLEAGQRQIRIMMERKATWQGSRGAAATPAEASQACRTCDGVQRGKRTSHASFACRACDRVGNADLKRRQNQSEAWLRNRKTSERHLGSNRATARKQKSRVVRLGSGALSESNRGSLPARLCSGLTFLATVQHPPHHEANEFGQRFNRLLRLNWISHWCDADYAVGGQQGQAFRTFWM